MAYRHGWIRCIVLVPPQLRAGLFITKIRLKGPSKKSLAAGGKSALFCAVSIEQD
jgi:hypothetical protein